MNSKAVDAAMLVMQNHISALNKHDATGVAATLHFPHYRLTGVTWQTWETADHYFEDFLNRAGSKWKHSAFEDIKVVDSSAEKVHLDAEIQRFDANDNLIIRFRALWVIVEINGVWAAKLRSTFAPG